MIRFATLRRESEAPRNVRTGGACRCGTSVESSPDIATLSRKDSPRGSGRFRTLALRRVGALAAVCALAACGDGDQASPAALRISYNGSTPFPAVVGEAIALTPAVSGRVDQYTVAPALPSGLSLNPRSGVISGTPTQPSASTVFVVSATGPGVRVTFPLVLSVTEPPHGLSYLSPVNATVGAILAPLSPSIAGNVDHYTVSPPLPTGLVLNGSSGILSGTPTEARSVAPYTIMAESLAGSTRFVLVLTVTPSRSGDMTRQGPTNGTRF
jgi:Putative Ig domain